MLSGELARNAWWERVHRAVDGRGPVGQKVLADWSHDILAVIGVAEERLELVGPFGQRRWQPVSPERCTEEYKARETRRLTDELGMQLGIGPKP